MRPIFYRGIMTGRLTANVLLFTIATAYAEFTRRTDYVTLGRVAFQVDSPAQSSANLLDLSDWGDHKTTPIRVNGVDLLVENYARTTPKETSMVASVRTMRPSLMRKQMRTVHEEPQKVKEEIDPAILDAISKPFVPKSVWSQLRGLEFDQPEVIEALVKSGLSMTESEDNEWITWKRHNGNSGDKAGIDEVQVHIGRCARDDWDQYYGANLPMLKTESLIRMKAKDIAELLLDSSRVQVYNKLSVGRFDIREIPCQHGIAKIVKNLTQPPITNKKIESTTFIHSRKLNQQGAYLVVSRAVSGSVDEAVDVNNGKSEILLGVNLLEPCEDQTTCKMTSVTHMYSPALPAVLATTVGIKSAINFINDIRGVSDPAQDNLAEK
jgi:hypothetical protein